MWRVKLHACGGNHLSSRSKGFTLAEVLVTLGIIGVVSAMTVLL
ncbi:MAG: type II secretion system protein [Candidatus Gastranaerophilaceae bacterium]